MAGAPASQSKAPLGADTPEPTTTTNPTAINGHVVFAVKSCPIDTLVTFTLSRTNFSSRPNAPFAPGCEIAGIIEILDEGVSSWAIDDDAKAFAKMPARAGTRKMVVEIA